VLREHVRAQAAAETIGPAGTSRLAARRIAPPSNDAEWTVASPRSYYMAMAILVYPARYAIEGFAGV
jgi:hypothetical protein